MAAEEPQKEVSDGQNRTTAGYILKAQKLDGIYITKEANVKYAIGYPDELAYAVIGHGAYHGERHRGPDTFPKGTYDS